MLSAWQIRLARNYLRQTTNKSEEATQLMLSITTKLNKVYDQFVAGESVSTIIHEVKSATVLVPWTYTRSIRLPELITVLEFAELSIIISSALF